MTQLQLTKGYKVVISRLDKPMQAASLRRTAPPQKHAAGAAEGPDRRETMNGMIDGWLAASAARHKRSTHAAYETVADRHIRPALGGCIVSELTADQLADFLMKKAAGGRGEQPLAPSTVGSIITVLRSVLQYAEARGCSVTAWAGLARPRPAIRPVRILTGAEQARLTDFLLENGERERLGVLVCLYTGLRLGEICALKWGDISSDSGTLSVKRTVQRIKSPSPGDGGHKTTMIFDTPKSRSSLRSIPLPSFLLQLLDRQRGEDGAFLLTGTEKFLEPRTLQNHFKTFLARAGVPNVNFHCLRHTFATNCVELGFDPKTLSMILGHADVSVTLNTYVHPSFSKIRACMELLGPGSGPAFSK